MKIKKRRYSKGYRVFLFKSRMLDIICLMLRDNPTKCYFCGKPFKPSDFPIDKPDRVHIHHISYNPEIKVLTHRTCHRKYHREQRKRKQKI